MVGCAPTFSNAHLIFTNWSSQHDEIKKWRSTAGAFGTIPWLWVFIYTAPPTRQSENPPFFYFPNRFPDQPETLEEINVFLLKLGNFYIAPASSMKEEQELSSFPYVLNISNKNAASWTNYYTSLSLRASAAPRAFAKLWNNVRASAHKRAAPFRSGANTIKKCVKREQDHVRYRSAVIAKSENLRSLLAELETLAQNDSVTHEVLRKVYDQQMALASAVGQWKKTVGSRLPKDEAALLKQKQSNPLNPEKKTRKS